MKGRDRIEVQEMIRQAEQQDSEDLAALIQQVESESPYMLYEARERNLTEEKQSKLIEAIGKQKNAAIFVVKKKAKLVGYLFAIGGQARKNKHSAYIVIGILSAYQGKGIGTALFQTLEHWALNNKLHRLELTVITENIAAVRLYEKVGYRKEGVKRNSLYANGKFVDEYYMGKILEGKHVVN